METSLPNLRQIQRAEGKGKKKSMKMYFNRARGAGLSMRDPRSSFVALCKKKKKALRSSIKMSMRSLPSWLTGRIAYEKGLPFFKIGAELGLSFLRLIKMHRKICFSLCFCWWLLSACCRHFGLGMSELDVLLVGVLHRFGLVHFILHLAA